MKKQILLIAAFTFFNVTKAYALDASRFCLVEVPIIGLTGIATEEKWRAVGKITVFENSAHPIFYSFDGFKNMQLDGYKLVNTGEEIPWNELFEDSILYHDK